MGFRFSLTSELGNVILQEKKIGMFIKECAHSLQSANFIKGHTFILKSSKKNYIIFLIKIFIFLNLTKKNFLYIKIAWDIDLSKKRLF